MRITLDPIIARDSYVSPIEIELVTYFDETIFNPLREILTARMNADQEGRSLLWLALLAGTVWYTGRQFFGRFSAAISKELRGLGAKKVSGGFELPNAKLPVSYIALIATVNLRSQMLHRTIIKTLERIEEVITTASTGFDFTKGVDTMVRDLQKQLAETVSKVSGLEVSPTPPELVETLAENLTVSADLTVKTFASETVQELRDIVKQNFLDGGRADQLRQIIESRYGVARRKAAFIADNETSLFTAAFRKARYTALGSKRYVWRTMGDSKVRPTHGESNNHRVLNSREFFWDSPPVVDPATGRTRHPGEDYGPCRCVALPILDLK